MAEKASKIDQQFAAANEMITKGAKTGPKLSNG
jgi:hypothetical protein